MQQDRLETFEPIAGDEFNPARGSLWGMLFFFTLLGAASAFFAYAWWYEVELMGGMVLTVKAGIVGIVGAPVFLFLALSMAYSLATAKRMILGADGLQMQSKDRVVVHIPYLNVEETGVDGGENPTKVLVKLYDAGDSKTLVPAGTKDTYAIPAVVYGKSAADLLQALNQRVTEFHLKRKK